VTLGKAALDAIGEDIGAQTAALGPPRDEDVAFLAAWRAGVDIRLAREAAADDVRASPPQAGDRGAGGPYTPGQRA
jgi:hypothetical protein